MSDFILKPYNIEHLKEVVDLSLIHIYGVPAINEKVVDVSGSRNALFAVGESGKVYACGNDD